MMKKILKKIKIGLFIFFILVTIPITKIYATTGNSNSVGTWGSTTYDQTKGSYNNLNQGIRITLVDENGDRIPGTISVDYAVNGSTLNGLDGNGLEGYYNTNVKRSRKEVLEEDEPNWVKQKVKMDTIAGINRFMYSDASEVANKIIENYFLKLTDAELEKLLDKMANDKTWKEITIDRNVCTKITNGYFIVEPLTALFDGNGNTYIGTGSELGLVVEEKNLGNLYTSAFMGYNIPYGIYLNQSYAGYSSVGNPTSPANPLPLDTFLDNPTSGYALGAYQLSSIDDIPGCENTCATKYGSRYCACPESQPQDDKYVYWKGIIGKYGESTKKYDFESCMDAALLKNSNFFDKNGNLLDGIEPAAGTDYLINYVRPTYEACLQKYLSKCYDNVYSCYEPVITCSSAECKETGDDINSAICKFKVQKEKNADSTTKKVTKLSSCTYSDVSNYGALHATLSVKGCKDYKVYCIEKSQVYYPGGFKNSLPINSSYISWIKTSPSNFETLSTLTCTVVDTNNKKVSSGTCFENAKKVMEGNNFYKDDDKTTASIKYQIPQVNGNSLSTATKNLQLEKNCTSSEVESTSTNKLKITRTCKFSLPKGKNIAVSKETKEFVDKSKKELTKTTEDDVLQTKYSGILPLTGYKFNEDLTDKILPKTYELSILSLPLGYGGRFTNLLEHPYTCEYKFTVDTEGEESCSCPPGTKSAGYSSIIEAYKAKYGVKDTEGVTCAEAITLCDEKLEYSCPPDSKVLGINKHITDCVNINKKTYDECVKEYYDECYCPTCQLYCYTSSGKQIDITSCVRKEQISSRISEKKAINICTKSKCSDNPQCPPNSKNSNWEDDLEMCIANGNSLDDCKEVVCDYDETPTCERNGIDIDISSCVLLQQAAGNSKTKAYSYCENKYCNGDTSNYEIIYRTISLENPFPSKNANEKCPSGLTIGDFNDSICGRYPGLNWNGKTLVKNKILNNRRYDGSELYNEATPLYTIDLTPSDIQKIREYNKNNTYSDFNLNCTEGAYCISSFLHSEFASIVTGGTCRNASNKITFNSCYTTKK